jgi:hypothetical protein
MLLIVFCKECCKVKTKGKWNKLTEEQLAALTLCAGKWKPIFVFCDECQKGGVS